MWFFRNENEKKEIVLSENAVRLRYQFYGRVQGVGFRFTIAHLADSLGLTGWVENEEDGSVLAEIQGDYDQINQCIRGLQKDSYIRIDHYDMKNVPIKKGENRFDYRY